MTANRLTVDRLRLELDGLEAARAEQIGGLLEQALRDRVAQLRLDARGWPAIELAGLDLGAIEAGPGRDAAALAGLIADRLVEWLERHAAEGGR